MSPEEARAFLERSIPRGAEERTGWATDIVAALTTLSIATTRENACAVVAVIGQESSFRVDPPIAGLGAIAWKEIDARAARAGIPRMLLHGVLQLKSSNGLSYAQRIDAAQTEHELSDVYEDFIGSVPLGRTLFDQHNPIRTRGPMQVQVNFAAQFAAMKPYPYPVHGSIEEELFSRRGGVYFGVAHLLGYAAPYDRYLYRFADFNAGQYASRNAAFQHAISVASGVPLVTDGALLSHEIDSQSAGSTELALRALRTRLNMSDAAIRSALEKSRSHAFEATALYTRVFTLAEQQSARALPRAMLPQIELKGPKITRKLTTEWYAHRVNSRYEACLPRATR